MSILLSTLRITALGLGLLKLANLRITIHTFFDYIWIGIRKRDIGSPKLISGHVELGEGALANHPCIADPCCVFHLLEHLACDHIDPLSSPPRNGVLGISIL